MAVANPYLQNEWEEWKREIEENRRRRWGETVSRWAEEEVSDRETEEKKHDGKEEDDKDNEKAEVNEEDDEKKVGAKVKEWEEEMEVKEAEEIEEEGEENKAKRGIKKNKKGDEVVTDTDGRDESEVEGEAKEKENAEKVVKEPQELDGGEEEAENEVHWELMDSEEVAEEQGMVKEAKRFNEKKEGQNEDELEGNLNGEVGEEEDKEVLEGEEMQEEQKEGKHEVEREVKDEKEENEAWEDEQVKEEDDGEEEHQERDQTGQNHLVKQLAEQMRRTEDDNENPESKAQDDDRVKDSDSVESMNTEDSDSMICEDICYSSERIKDDEQHVETQTMQNPDEQLWKNGNPILGAWTFQERNEGEDNEKTDEEQVAEMWETQEEEFQDDHKGLQDEESTDDEEAEYSMEDEDSDDEDVKVYSKDHYPTDIFHTLTQFKDLFLLTDLTLSTKEGTNFHVHSPVLAAVSSLIWGHLNSSNRAKDNASVGLHRWSVSLDPPVDYFGLQAVVEFAYTGMISCLNKDTVEQIRTAAERLGIPRVLILCTEEEEKSTKSGGQKKGERISASEQMRTSLQSIKQLWMDKVGCDVILGAQGESLHVHRVILAASSDYFRGMFTLGMRESHESCVALPFLMAQELEVLISCSYSGVLPLNWKCVFEITSTALQLQYQPALSLCFKFLQQEINPHSCLDVASFAEAYEMVQLLDVADDFVLRQFQKVACTSKFKDLPAKQLLKYLNSHSLCVPSELVVFKAVVAWIQAKPKKRLKLAKELMKTIHFPLMTFKEFKEVQSLQMWSDHSLEELYEAIFQDFCSSETTTQSQCRIYLPKESLVLIGGDQISEDLGSRSISRDLWFGNSLRNHTGIKKAMEWRRLGEMPEPARFSHEVAVLKGQLYVFGGKKYYGVSDTLNSVYRYDPLQSHWENLADMQEKRCSFSVVVLDDKIYAIGGHCDPGYIDSVEQYCPIANSWRFTWPLDLPLSGHVAKVLQRKIFISGGQNSDYQCLSSMFLYHPEEGSTYKANMIKPRAHHCMETLGECLYVAGGVTTDDNITVVDQLACEVYCPADDAWTVFTSLPVPHVGAGSAVLEGKFYVLGGYSLEDYTDTKMVHRYDHTIQRWENMGKMPGPNNDIRASLLCLPSHFRDMKT